MPIYEYVCDKCHHMFEKLVLKADKEEIICPACNEPVTRKVMSVSHASTGSTHGCGHGVSKGGFS